MSALPGYERDPYLRELDVEVLAARGEGERPFALLDDTILYPEGGGQPADHGRLGEAAVVDVRRESGEIRHYLDRSVAEGPARLRLDWDRRLDHMQQHTAQHLLSALALARFEWTTRAFHLGPEVSDIELAVEPPPATRLEELEEEVNGRVAAALAITTRRVSREEYEALGARSRGLPAGHTGDIRLVEIAGVDLNTCGGTHVRSTAEVGAVKILSAEPQRGGCRVYWVAGRRLRRRLADHELRSARLRGLFDAGDDDLSDVAALKLEQLTVARRRQRHLESRLADALAHQLAARDETLIEAHFEDEEASFVQRLARAFAERAGARVALLSAGREPEIAFAVAAGEESAIDPQAAGRRVAELLDGRGGGSGRVFQGKATTLARRAAAVEAVRGAGSD
jgi:Ser-tRNA(Ala) deacylase AlaX